MINKVKRYALCFICLIMITIVGVNAATSGKVKISSTTNTPYGSVNVSTANLRYSTTYDLQGSNVSGQVWVDDLHGNKKTTSGARGSNEAGSITSFKAEINKIWVGHEHYYQYWTGYMSLDE